MSRQYLRGIDRALVAFGLEPEPSYDERKALKEDKRALQRKAMREIQQAADERKRRQQAADATHQKVMAKHPEITKWYWPEID